MSDAIRLVIQCSVPAGKAGEAKVLLREAIDLCQEKDMGLLSYEYFFDESESEFYALEWYKDSAAVLTHMGIVGETLNKLLETVQITRAEVFGNASDELIEAFVPFSAKVFRYWGGFTR